MDGVPALARILLDALRAAGSPFPPALRADEELAPHLRRDVLPRDEVWLAEEEAGPVALFSRERVGSVAAPPAVKPDLLGQVAIDSRTQGRGLGRAVVERALALRPDDLDPWVRTSSTRARTLHRRHGFEVVGGTSS